MGQLHGYVPGVWWERHGAGAVVEGAEARMVHVADKGGELEQHLAERVVAGEGHRHGPIMDRESEAEPMPGDGRKVRHRDCLAGARPGIGDPPADDQRAIGSLHEEGVEEHLVGGGHSPGVWRGTLAGTRVASDPG